MTETAIIAAAHRLIGRRIRGSRARIDAEVAAIAPLKQTGHLRFLVAI